MQNATNAAKIRGYLVELKKGKDCSIDLLGSMVVGVYDLRASNIGPLGCQK